MNISEPLPLVEIGPKQKHAFHALHNLSFSETEVFISFETRLNKIQVA